MLSQITLATDHHAEANGRRRRVRVLKRVGGGGRWRRGPNFPTEGNQTGLMSGESDLTFYDPLQKMVEEDRYCADIMTQIASVHEALRAVGRELMRNHLRHCAAKAVRAGGDTAEEMYDELVEMMYRAAR